MLENIFRYMEEKGVSARAAASAATGEISLAVMATTLSLVVIFLPVAFMEGEVGRFFNSYGVTVAIDDLSSAAKERREQCSVQRHFREGFRGGRPAFAQ